MELSDMQVFLRASFAVPAPCRAARRLLLPLGLLLIVSAPTATAGSIEGLRTWAAPDHSRVVLDLSEPVKYQVFSLENPHRLVVDIEQSRLQGKIPSLQAHDKYLRGIRSGVRKGTGLRMVLDLKQAARPRHFLLEPYQKYGYRLVIDLYPKEQKKSAPRSEKPRKIVHRAPVPVPRPRDVTIAIDAGHGGDDPGAHGPAGSREKDIVLQISKHLAKLIGKEPGMQALLLREGDYYLKLGTRVAKARAQKADLFLSIHADAFEDPRIRGSSVYVLSRKGASSAQARILADQENAADLIGGVTLSGKDNLLASVLVDLSQTAALEASIDAAQQILNEFNQVGKIRKRPLESANFMVLRAPDVPSILIETGYLTNPEEEKRLRSADYQQQLAGAMLRGIRAYFKRRAPEGTWLASKHKTVSQN